MIAYDPENRKIELDNLCARALVTWGPEAQVHKAQEEAGEFIVAAAHRRAGRRGSEYNFAEEIADVEIMMAQMRKLVDSGLVDRIKTRKLRRLQKRLDAADETRRRSVFEHASVKLVRSGVR